jgi:hypothetical protein
LISVTHNATAVAIKIAVPTTAATVMPTLAAVDNPVLQNYASLSNLEKIDKCKSRFRNIEIEIFNN